MHMNEASMRPIARPADNQGAPPGQAALLIDFDNVTMGIRSNLGQELHKLLNSAIIRGKVSIQRAYADWRRYPQYIAPLSEASIDLIFAPAYGSSKKNATDIRLSIDALEIVFTRPEVTTFILLSGDSDFSSMVLKLKEYGKYVIGVGIQESSSDLLVQNCDEYYSYSSLSGLTSALDMPSERHDPWELVERAIDRMVERKDVMRSDRLKQVLLELDPNFSEKEIGFSKFNRFLTEAASRGILSLHKAANGQYEVAPGEARRTRGGAASTESVAAEPTRRSDRSGGRRGRPSSGRRRAEPRPRPEEPPQVDEGRLREAYRLLKSVVRELAGRGGSVRDSEVKRRMLEKDATFDEAALGFGKFSRFLHQASDEAVVSLERGTEGNYQVSSIEAEEGSEPVPERPPRRERRDGSGRSRRGGRRDEDSREREAVAAGPAESEAGPEEKHEPEQESSEPAATAPRARAPSRRSETQPEPQGTISAPGEAERRPTLGRFRRGSRGRSAAAPAAATATGSGSDSRPESGTAGGDAGEPADRPVAAPVADEATGPEGSE